jgi:hypothetical protein
MLGKGQGGSATGMANPVWSKHAGKCVGFSQGGAGPRDGVASWVAKPLGGSPSVATAWVVLPKMVEAQGFPIQQGQGPGGRGGKIMGSKPCGQSPKGRQRRMSTTGADPRVEALEG